MTAIHCPYCNASVNLPLKFCLSCGRAITQQDLRKFSGMKVQLKAAITKRLSDTMTHASFRRAKKSYRVQRVLRQILLNLCYVLIIFLLFYVIIKYISTDALPDTHAEPEKQIVQPLPKKHPR